MKIRAKKNLYYLPRISEGEYLQSEIDNFLSCKISEGDIFESCDSGWLRGNPEDGDEWALDHLNSENFEIIEE